MTLLKFNNDHLCNVCEYRKNSKKGHPILIEKSISERLELLHIDLCGPSVVESLNHKKYILVMVDDYTIFTSVFFLKLKLETNS